MERRTFIAALAAGLAGCTTTERVVVREREAPARNVVLVDEADPAVDVYEAPPPVIREVVSVRPAPTHVWIAGFWGYRSGRYVWIPGRWIAPPRPYAVWVPGQWVAARGAWRWRRGYWR